MMNGKYTTEKYQANKERIKAAAKKWRDANPDKCRAARERKKEQRALNFQKWKEANPERLKELYRERNYRKQYGLGIADYEKLLDDQGRRCAICKTDTPGGRGRFHVDHCHDSGKVRAILCHACNTGIGYLKHDCTIMLAALKYIARHEQA
ncbi:MAG: endonuclease VII domain-containing protein [Nitrososphaera sp.]|nr:endonuclease VII domain-containing protein [Nitrososphaera sp.]